MEDNIEKNTDNRELFEKKRILVPIVMTLTFLLGGIYFLIYSHFYQSTDDAFVEGKLISIAPKVSGQIRKIYINDNQYVKKGQLLIEIDSIDYEIKLKQTEAKLEEAKANLNIIEKQILQSKACVEQSNQDTKAAHVKLDFSQKDYNRYSKMYDAGISSKQEYDSSKTSMNVHQANYKSSQEKTKAAQSSLQSMEAKRDAAIAEIKRLEAEVEADKTNLSYTKIYAPQDGNISSKNIEEGNYVQIAQPLMAIVNPQTWIVANFKETQLENMKNGQSVTIKIDTYPHKKFKGKVDSIQRATGAKSSLFPPENAVGSYVKIVQRIPVKITFVEDYSQYNIAPGMSVVPTVKVK